MSTPPNPTLDPQLEAELRTTIGRSIFGKLETIQHLQSLYGGQLFYQGVLLEKGTNNTDEKQNDEISESKIEENISRTSTKISPPKKIKGVFKTNPTISLSNLTSI
jgi:hypothetical protein